MKHTTICSLMSFVLVMAACNSAPDTNTQNRPNDSVGTNRQADSALKTAAPPLPLATYTGKLPCADCMEMAVTLNLLSDSSFRKTTVYMGKSTDELSDTGKWMMHGDTLHLRMKQESAWYLKTDSGLVQLDKSGKRITGKLADRYVLKKTN